MSKQHEEEENINSTKAVECPNMLGNIIENDDQTMSAVQDNTESLFSIPSLINLEKQEIPFSTSTAVSELESEKGVFPNVTTPSQYNGYLPEYKHIFINLNKNKNSDTHQNNNSIIVNYEQNQKMILKQGELCAADENGKINLFISPATKNLILFSFNYLSFDISKPALEQFKRICSDKGF